MTEKKKHESRFLEAPFVRQVDGKLKNVPLPYTYFLRSPPWKKIYTIILKKIRVDATLWVFFQVQILKYLRWHPQKYFSGCRLKGQHILWQFFNVFSLFVYLLYKPPALFATCKVTRILSLPTPPDPLSWYQRKSQWSGTTQCIVLFAPLK